MNGDGIHVRRARPDESAALTALTRRSKAYWGYPAELVDRLARSLVIAPEAVRAGWVVVAERGGVPVGWYQLGGTPPDGELADMFLAPEVIGTGLGRRLWQHAADTAGRAGFRTLTWDSDPHAEGFYLHMGAERIGGREVAPGRVLPVLRAALPG